MKDIQKKPVWADPHDLILTAPSLHARKGVSQTAKAIQNYKKKCQLALRSRQSGRSDWIVLAKIQKLKNKETEHDTAASDFSIHPNLGQNHGLNRADPLVTSQSYFKSIGNINIFRCKDVKGAATKHYSGAIRSLEFHPIKPLLFSSGLDKSFSIFEVDKDQSVTRAHYHLSDFPIHCSHFTPDGEKIIHLGPRKSLVEYSLETMTFDKIPGIAGRSSDRRYTNLVMPSQCHPSLSSHMQKMFALSVADDGYVLLCDLKSKRLIHSYKMNAQLTGMAFHPTEDLLYTTDSESYMYLWDLRKGACMNRVYDNHAFGVTSLAASSNSQPFLVSGCSSGYLNLYDCNTRTSAIPRVVKSFPNLTTAITGLRFNPRGDLLCAASQWKDHSLRLIHLPTQTVISNWPTKETPLKRVTAFDFSSFGNYLSMGNDQGKILLYSLKG